MNRVVYLSMGGNTKKLAEAIAKGAGAPAVSAERFNASEPSDVLYVGASIYAGSTDGKLRQFLAGLRPFQAKRAVVFGTSAGKKTVLREVKSILKPKGITVSDGAFHCKGAFVFADRGRPNEGHLKQAEAFAKRVRGGRP